MRYIQQTYHDNTHPLIKMLCEEMNRQQCTQEQLAQRAGVDVRSFRRWKTNYRGAQFGSLEACWNALGYDLKPVHIKEDTGR